MDNSLYDEVCCTSASDTETTRDDGQQMNYDGDEIIGNSFYLTYSNFDNNFIIKILKP